MQPSALHDGYHGDQVAHRPHDPHQRYEDGDRHVALVTGHRHRFGGVGAQ